jgi:hypothetical protein
MCQCSYVPNVATYREAEKINVLSAGSRSRSISQRSRCTVQPNSIICPAHGLARREAGDQCAECNGIRTKEYKERGNQ